jgi:hypothetical protein
MIAVTVRTIRLGTGADRVCFAQQLLLVSYRTSRLVGGEKSL